MPKVASAVVLSEADRSQLETWVPSPIYAAASRAPFTYFVAGVCRQTRLGNCLGTRRKPPYAGALAKRVQTQGLEGLWEIQAGRGRKPSYDGDKVAAMVAATLQTKPKGSTHWSCRTMARGPKGQFQHHQPTVAGL